jgi:hypothetical protein
MLVNLQFDLYGKCSMVKTTQILIETEFLCKIWVIKYVKAFSSKKIA